MSAQPLNLYNVTPYTQSKKGKVIGNYAGNSVEVEYVFDVTDAPAASATDDSIHTIPAGSVIEECKVFVQGTVSGGTNFSIGLQTPAGAEIDNDGLVAASVVTAVGSFVEGAGADIGTVASTSSDAQVVYSGTRTAGVLKVLVKYKKA